MKSKTVPIQDVTATNRKIRVDIMANLFDVVVLDANEHDELDSIDLCKGRTSEKWKCKQCNKQGQFKLIFGLTRIFLCEEHMNQLANEIFTK